MTLLALGVNHKSTPLLMRERLVFAKENVIGPLQDLTRATKIREVALLSTCNRMEIYCDSDNYDAVWQWISQRHALPTKDLQDYSYCLEERDAIKHMIRVASGLDSIALGESQVFGQMKTAFQLALTAGTVGPLLHRTFQYVFSAAKRVRRQTGIGQNAVSFAQVGANLARQMFAPNLEATKALVVGSGEVAALILRYLRRLGVGEVVVVNRTLANAEVIAERFDAVAQPLSQLTELLPIVDMVFTATASSKPLIDKDMVECAINLRRHKPLLMVDLAMPRDVEAAVESVKGVYLYPLDAIQKIVNDNLKHREVAALQAETMIEAFAEHFVRWQNSLSTVSTALALREKIGRMSAMEVKRALHALQLGIPAETIITLLGESIAKKVMHYPTVKIKQAGYNANEALLAAVRELFDLP